MAIDIYSPCPGGTGKKIKFCCPDFVGELDKINRMIEGEQFQGCLDLVRRNLKTLPTRACLMASECLLLRVTDQLEEAVPAAERFLAAHPENPLAWAETAIVTAVTGGGLAAMVPLQKALAHSGREISGRVYEMLWTVGQILAIEGDCLAAEAVLSLQAFAMRDDTRPVRLPMELHRRPARSRFGSAIPPGSRSRRPMPRGRPSTTRPWRSPGWASGASPPSGWPRWPRRPASRGFWYNVGLMRAWAGEHEAAVESLRKYAAMDVPLEDAVEAEALAMHLSDDPLGDRFDRFRLEYEVEDADRLMESLSSARCIEALPIDAAREENDEGPPPKAAFLVGDREKATSTDPISLDSLAKVLGLVRLYGRETDRPARLEVLDVAAGDLVQLKAVSPRPPGRCRSPRQGRADGSRLGHAGPAGSALARAAGRNSRRLPASAPRRGARCLDQPLAAVGPGRSRRQDAAGGGRRSGPSYPGPGGDPRRRGLGRRRDESLRFQPGPHAARAADARSARSGRAGDRRRSDDAAWPAVGREALGRRPADGLPPAGHDQRHGGRHEVRRGDRPASQLREAAGAAAGLRLAGPRCPGRDSGPGVHQPGADRGRGVGRVVGAVGPDGGSRSASAAAKATMPPGCRGTSNAITAASPECPTRSSRCSSTSACCGRMARRPTLPGARPRGPRRRPPPKRPSPTRSGSPRASVPQARSRGFGPRGWIRRLLEYWETGRLCFSITGRLLLC